MTSFSRSAPSKIEAMRRTLWTQWIWFAGCAAWTIDAAVSVHLRDPLHAKLAIMVAAVFFVAGLFYRGTAR
jgi:NADH:ubiquinone oxidoreductase subunit 6 (subunit J)